MRFFPFCNAVMATCMGAALLCPPSALAIDTTHKEVAAFIDEMSTEHALDTKWVDNILNNARYQPKIVEAMSRPAERVKPWHEYRDIFIQEKRISKGAQFWREHEQTLQSISDKVGVPPQIIVGILGVETRYGDITGSYRVVDALVTLAFRYPPRSRFFRSELEQFLLLVREEQIDPLAAKGSYAGAMGAPQFISSSYRHYSIDADGDGRRDLFGNWGDVAGSVANYFVKHGWRRDQPTVSRATLERPEAAALADGPLKLNHTVGSLREAGVKFDSSLPDNAGAMLVRLQGASGVEYWVGFRNYYVITRYNRSRMYAMAVHQLGGLIAQRVQSDDPR